MKNKKGTVYLIGAGPGEADLITVKGKKILGTCDTVVYDALVNEVLINSLPAHIGRIFVGKRGGKPSVKQDEINRILVEESKKGALVARVKGGDSFVFGRGSEEMEYLHARGIPYKVIPGITSAIAAPSYAGIPITHRSISRSFAVATGHLQAGESADNLEIPKADTIIFLMAMQHLPLIVNKLLTDTKFTTKTPAALIRNGTHPDQETVIGTLGNIVQKRDLYDITPPTVFIVGNTVPFGSMLAWRERLPLAGVRVAVLRTNEQSGELLEQLSEVGATVLQYPLIRIVPRERAFETTTREFLSLFTSCIFTSPNGVAVFMNHLLEKGIDARALGKCKIYALGSGTAAVLRKYGLLVDALPEKYIAEGLLSVLPHDLQGENILIPRAALARSVLPDTLKKRGAMVTVLPVYDTVAEDSTGYSFRDGDYVLFTSSSMVDFFYSNPERKNLAINPCCIGDITAKTLSTYFHGTFSVAENATIQALIQALCNAVEKNKKRNKKA